MYKRRRQPPHGATEAPKGKRHLFRDGLEITGAAKLAAGVVDMGRVHVFDSHAALYGREAPVTHDAHHIHVPTHSAYLCARYVSGLYVVVVHRH